ncbi:coiled-coil domain-containing protein 102A-like isoform X2 [Physella acuta]|uniref:coiled-coil domain-containing protein 102A-like isoform X2 n=1 Tax=Physella acuta TaxID=109671 RepID=UPI0027DBB65E|nr:coiled-coil domain-containing protein 102A-like isoform X2 [Physella acuta]
MSKNSGIASPGAGSIRGDVSFIRATSGSGSSLSSSNQNLDKITPHHVNQLPSAAPRLSQDMPIQPHLYHQQHHHHPRPLSQQQHQQSHQHQYVPEHMEGQQYLLKQPHGACGASGDSAGRVQSAHTGVEGWSDREETLAAELEEAKIRVSQMEKTMRWWSDCTSNWREKWNKARNERNKAREENRILRAKLEALAKEFSRVKRENKEMFVEKEKVQECSQVPSISSLNQSQEKLVELSEKEKTILALSNEKEFESLDDLSETSSSVSKISKDKLDEKEIDDTDRSTTHEESVTGERTYMVAEISERLTQLQERQAHLEQQLAQSQSKASQAEENVMEMQRKLDGANNTIQAEKMENSNHLKVIDKLQKELKEVNSKLTDELHGKQQLMMQFEKMKEMHQEELTRLTLDLEDEACSRTTMDKRVTELRRELERIQADNAAEWAKRERLESDKLALERENKKLRIEVADLQEELEKRNQTSTSMADSDIKTLQFELTEKTKELSDLRHVHSKLKKALTERSTELEHTRRRAEQYETEVRKLRSRVDELKHDLAAAEDEVDNQGNAARKAQRTNDELQAQVESLQVQVNHLQSRLRRNPNSGAPTPRSTSLKSLTLEDSAELADSENDFEDN